MRNPTVITKFNYLFSINTYSQFINRKIDIFVLYFLKTLNVKLKK